jgi:hypothetical protein
MSKLIDRLSNLNKSVMPAMGFRTASAGANTGSMIVMAEVTGKPEGEIKEIAGAGVAAVIIDSSGLNASALAKYTRNPGDMIMGLSLTGGKAASGWKLVTDDVDFIVFDADAQVDMFQGKDLESLGKVLKLPLDTEPGLLRSVHSLYPDIDAVLIDLRVTEMTVQTLMDCRRVADFSGQHILALVDSPLSEIQLLSLRGAGVKGLVFPSKADADELKSDVDRVAALPRPDKRKDRKDVVLLPKLGLSPAPKEEGGGDGENGDDDDDE